MYNYLFSALYSALSFLFPPLNQFLYHTAGNTVFCGLLLSETRRQPLIHIYTARLSLLAFICDCQHRFALFFSYCFYNSSPSAVHSQLHGRSEGHVIHPRAIMILFTATFSVLQLVIMRRPFLLFSSTVSPRLVTLRKVKRSMKMSLICK